MPHIPQLQILRAVAALGVLAHHTNEAFAPTANVFAFGQYGVDLFFVLSGFVIQMAHGKEIGNRAALPSYLMRRFSRIYPPYFIFSAAFLPLALYRSPSLVSSDYFIASGFILPADHHILEVAWTLAHEVKFYLAFAAIVALPRWAGIPILAAALVASAVAWITGNETFFFTSFNIEFAAGMVGCVVFQRGISPRAAAVLLLAGAALVAAGLAEGASRFIVGGVPAALAVLGIASICLRSSILERIGNASYTLYLIHYPFLFVVGASLRHFALPQTAFSYACGAVAIIALSVFASEHIEIPSTRLFRDAGAGAWRRIPT